MVAHAVLVSGSFSNAAMQVQKSHTARGYSRKLRGHEVTQIIFLGPLYIWLCKQSAAGTDNLTCPDLENLASTFMRLPYSILKTHLS